MDSIYLVLTTNLGSVIAPATKKSSERALGVMSTTTTTATLAGKIPTIGFFLYR